MKYASRSTMDELRLIIDASQGDLDAFNYLVLKYQDLVFSRAYGLLGDCHSAEDAAQESFLKAFQNINRFRGGSFRAWLFTIVTNHCYDEMRWSKRHPTAPLIPEENECAGRESPRLVTDSNCTIQVMVERNELSRILNCFLDELPEIYRNPITLIDLHELDYSEAAEVLEIPLGTLKSRLARARFQMKEKLQRTFEYPGSISPSDVMLVV